MKIYNFAPISARNFPTIADLNNPWIYPKDVAVVISVSQNYDTRIAAEIMERGMEYYQFPLSEGVDDMGWSNIKQAVALLLESDATNKRMVVHCDFGQHRSRVVVEAFHFAKCGTHLLDEYKGYDNHLIYDCLTDHLPTIDHVEQELFNLRMTILGKTSGVIQ